MLKVTHRYRKVIPTKSPETDNTQSEYLPYDVVNVIPVYTLKSFSRKTHCYNIWVYIWTATLGKSREVWVRV